MTYKQLNIRLESMYKNKTQPVCQSSCYGSKIPEITKAIFILPLDSGDRGQWLFHPL